MSSAVELQYNYVATNESNIFKLEQKINKQINLKILYCLLGLRSKLSMIQWCPTVLIATGLILLNNLYKPYKCKPCLIQK